MDRGGNSAQRRKYRRFLVRTLGEETASQIMDKKTSKRVALSDKRTELAALRYLKASGAIGIVFGVGGLTLSSILFWWGAGFLYGALLVWLIDVTLEPELSKPT